MSYEVFKAKVNALIKRAGGGIKVWFSSDSEVGKHYANCSDLGGIFDVSLVIYIYRRVS